MNNEDVHGRTASEVFGILPGLVTTELRRRAKAINFGIIYGMGPHGLSTELGISVGEAKNYIDEYFLHYKGVKEFIDSTIVSATELGYTKTIMGRKRLIPELNANNDHVVKLGQRLAVNTPIQGSAADIIKVAMLGVHRRLIEEFPDSRMILQIHDELIVEAKEGDTEGIKSLLTEEMEGVLSLEVPLTVNVSTGRDWRKAG